MASLTSKFLNKVVLILASSYSISDYQKSNFYQSDFVSTTKAAVNTLQQHHSYECFQIELATS